ncbi:MAG: hypothetical protein HYT27_02870 [Parcubacteria group bacterium]|nr:hypothetical protein [Parcubacteria group bacterium]
MFTGYKKILGLSGLVLYVIGYLGLVYVALFTDRIANTPPGWERYNDPLTLFFIAAAAIGTPLVIKFLIYAKAP